MIKLYSSKNPEKLIGFAMSEADFKNRDDQYVGLCLKCGHERSCCEPDAREYDCEECDENQVYGMQELLVMGKIRIE
jgi:hypothetical protein